MTSTPPPSLLAAAALLGDEPVRGLTVRQPWTSAITYMGKEIENRSRIFTYTGWLLIHSAQGIDRVAMSQVSADYPGVGTRGAVMAVARLAGCHSPSPEHCDEACTRWGEPDRVHLRITDVTPLRTPVPATGKLYLWEPTPEQRTRIAAELPVEPPPPHP